MRRNYRHFLALALLSALLTGCSGIGEALPTALGGLPKGAPERPADPGVFPAVHDMPPPRFDQVLDDTEQVKLEQDLKALRDRQEGRAAQ